MTKSVPYQETRVTESRTRDQINEILIKSGVFAIQWTDTPYSIQGNEMPILQFIIKATLKGVEYQFGVKLQPPLLETERGRGYDKKKMPNRDASMRLLHWYVKSKLEAIEYGLEDQVEAWMPRIIICLPDGSTQTMAEALKTKRQIMSKVFMLTDPQGAKKQPEEALK